MRPNILWLTCEDIGPDLGCYGDGYADTPNLDALAERGVIYRNAWSEAPVCAPARTDIITGVYSPCTGSEHMRSMLATPHCIGMYPQLLREAGYYCTNNSKEDYNLEKPGQVWDESSGEAHWRNREAGQPFFAIFNYTVTHESRIRKRPHELQHDPDLVDVPAYHPDTPEVRRDWAQYYDIITAMDAQVGEALAELAEAGLAEDTIVFFYGDHGSGMPGHKRDARNAGLLVPLIVAIPPKFRHLASADYVEGGATDRLVGFTDLGPTVLSLAGVQPPEVMQGRAFMGRHEAPPRSYLHGFRGRMDERYDMVRCTRDQRYIYIRNFMPHLPRGQHVAYQLETPSTRAWKRLYEEGKLNAAQSAFWEPRPPEELYDLQEGPDEVTNLADSEEHRDVLERLREANRQWLLDIRDVGFLPEPEIHRRSEGSTPYEVGHDPQRYPLERIMAAAERASSLHDEAVPALLEDLGREDCAVRYWAAMGLMMRGEEAVAAGRDELMALLDDESKAVRVAAAEALGCEGDEADAAAALEVLVELADAEVQGPYVAMMALNAIDHMGQRAAPALNRIRELPDRNSALDRRVQYGIPNLLEKIISDLEDAWK
ncbi:MAG: sulfatase-like hydrolase/transferase [Armatimonadota bacterium]|nr:sulfatase-like hydrolase/transferase [Armatimonadota bacterium]